MKNIYVKTKTTEHIYPIYIEKDFGCLAQAFEDAGLRGRKVCIITDDNVAPLYLDEIEHIISGLSHTVCHYVFPAGEESKSLRTIEGFYECFADNKLDRKSVIIALGGGVTGDMAGFAAATYMRGIAYVQLPTTLLAQVDSSVGGKTGVDCFEKKNLVGAFYQPQFVYINTGTLKTLPRCQFSAGMGEVVKHGLIADADYYKYIMDNKDKINLLDVEALSRVVTGSCQIKSAVVSEDEKEQGLREILNFGHTFGHAIESVSGFTIPHGHCVGFGMLCAMRMSSYKGAVAVDDIIRLKQLMKDFDMPTELINMDIEMIYESMFSDKKTTNDRINLILLKEIGSSSHGNHAGRDEILDALRYIAIQPEENKL